MFSAWWPPHSNWQPATGGWELFCTGEGVLAGWCRRCPEFACEPHKHWRKLTGRRATSGVVSQCRGSAYIGFHPRAPTARRGGCRDRSAAGFRESAWRMLRIFKDHLAALSLLWSCFLHSGMLSALKTHALAPLWPTDAGNERFDITLFRCFSARCGLSLRKLTC